MFNAGNEASSLLNTTSNSNLLSRTKFYEETAWELLKARTILCASYVYAYFHLETHKTSKSWFELMQYELEDVTEKLAELLQRPPSFRTASKRSLIQAGQSCFQKRSDFLKAVYNGLQFEDPWMNRNLTVSTTASSRATAGGTTAATATLNRHHQRKKREDRQIWTKTLSYPNK